jgi:DNA polymerase
MNESKAARLDKLRKDVRSLEASPLYDYRKENDYLPVVGEGDPDAEIMFIGEAPGREEAETGRPFVGNAGRVLDSLLESIGLDREHIYITNVVKDRPPGNRDPRVQEIEVYAPFLLRQIEIIRPDVIATLGRFAMDFILEQYDLPQQGKKIGELHGKLLKAEGPHGEVTVVPLYHPAAAFYNQDLEDTMEDDFRVLEQFA